MKTQWDDGASEDFPGSFYNVTYATSFSILALAAGLPGRKAPLTSLAPAAGSPRELLAEMLAGRLSGEAAGWIARARAEIARGVEPGRFSELLSTASRHAARRESGRGLAPTPTEIERAAAASEGWNPERWSLLDAARALLVLSRSDLAEPTTSEALEESFRFADVGEMCALHCAIQFLPHPERFLWRAGEGCRSSLRVVFEAAACDTGYPAANFEFYRAGRSKHRLRVHAPTDTSTSSRGWRSTSRRAAERQNVQHELAVPRRAGASAASRRERLQASNGTAAWARLGVGPRWRTRTSSGRADREGSARREDDAHRGRTSAFRGPRSERIQEQGRQAMRPLIATV